MTIVTPASLSPLRKNTGTVRSLRSRLLTLLGVVLVMTLVSIGLGVIYFVSLTEQQAWQDRQTEAARHASDAVAAFIERIGDTLALAGQLESDDVETSPQALNRLVEHNPAILELVRLDAQGRVLAGAFQDVSVLANLFTLQQANWFQSAAKGRLYLGDINISAANEPYLIMAGPAAEGGVVAVRLRMTVLWDLMTKIRFGETGTAYIVTPTGQIVAHTNPNVALSRTSIEGRPELSLLLAAPDQNWQGAYSNFQGTPVLGSTASIPGTPWIVITELTQTEAHAVTVRALLLLGGGLLLFGAVVLAVTSRLLERLLFRPMEQLRDGARQFGQGNLDHRINLTQPDEIGQVAATFDQTAAELQGLYGNLEQQVANRTRQLQTVVDVSQRLTSILDLNDLMREVVHLIKERFNYYHVHIYLLGEAGDTLLMAEGYGEAGAEMKRRAHQIPLTAPKSLVARAARESKTIIVEDVHRDPDWLPNPLLPETRSEIAIPVQYGAEVVGVLDVQSDEVGGLRQEDEAVLRALANQVANAARNVRQFAATQAALERAQHLQAVYTGQAWHKLGGDRAREYDHRQSAFLLPLKEVPTPEAQAALQKKRTVDLRLPASAAEHNGLGMANVSLNALATPLQLRGQVIGVLGLQNEDPHRRWTADEIALIEAVSEQMSLALDNARLFEETQRNAWRDRLISESTAEVWSSTEIEAVMRAAVAQLGDKLEASEVVIRLGTVAEMAQE